MYALPVALYERLLKQMFFPAAAFLEFHDILAAFLDPANKDKEDTLLTSNELYHNYVRCDVRYKEPRQ